MDMKDKGQSSAMAESSRTKVNTKELKRSKSGTRLSAPLGIQTKKTEFLRRGSPRMRSTKSRHTPAGEKERERRLRRDSKRIRVGTTSDGLMDSKNPSKKHL